MTNLSAEVSLSWAGGKYLFALKAKQIEGLEHDCGKGIGLICMRIFSRADFSFKEMRQAIYWGLQGGGMTPTDAQRLVLQYVDGCPIDAAGDPCSNLKTAGAILQAAYFGWESLPPGEAKAPETPAPKQTSDFTEPPSYATG